MFILQDISEAFLSPRHIDLWDFQCQVCTPVLHHYSLHFPVSFVFECQRDKNLIFPSLLKNNGDKKGWLVFLFFIQVLQKEILRFYKKNDKEIFPTIEEKTLEFEEGNHLNRISQKNVKELFFCESFKT